MQSFGERLKAAMKAKNVKGVDLAAQVGVSGSSVSLYISGRNFPQAGQMIKIKEALNVNLNWLIAGDGEMFLAEKEMAPQEVEEPTAERLNKELARLRKQQEQLLEMMQKQQAEQTRIELLMQQGGTSMGKPASSTFLEKACSMPAYGGIN